MVSHNYKYQNHNYDFETCNYDSETRNYDFETHFYDIPFNNLCLFCGGNGLPYNPQYFMSRYAFCLLATRGRHLFIIYLEKSKSVELVNQRKRSSQLPSGRRSCWVKVNRETQSCKGGAHRSSRGADLFVAGNFSFKLRLMHCFIASYLSMLETCLCHQ